MSEFLGRSLIPESKVEIPAPHIESNMSYYERLQFNIRNLESKLREPIDYSSAHSRRKQARRIGSLMALRRQIHDLNHDRSYGGHRTIEREYMDLFEADQNVRHNS